LTLIIKLSSLVSSFVTVSKDLVIPLASPLVLIPFSTLLVKSSSALLTLTKLVFKSVANLSGSFKLFKEFYISLTPALTLLASNKALMFKV